jgi:UDP-2,4-diacetamido-2,4,6-trideoxy-beta-L-altropyranose hydrolase
MNLLIRADASVAMGTGHVMRCLALAQAWQDTGGRATFLIGRGVLASDARLQSEAVEVVPLNVSPGTSDDAGKVVQFAHERNAEWIVVDGGHFDESYEHILKKSGLKLLVMNDGGLDRSCSADFILNQNCDAAESMYLKCDSRTRLLLGSRYILLRKDFLGWREWKREVRKRSKRLLVTMGGSDPDNLTGLVIQALRVIKAKELQVEIIAGNSNPHLDLLRSEAADLELDVRFERHVSDMPERMAQADFAIIAAGGTLWEALFMSCPTLSFGRDPVQRNILNVLEAQGIVCHLGDPKETQPSQLAVAIGELADSYERRAKMATAGPELVDGKGGRRVCEILLSNKMTLI